MTRRSLFAAAFGLAVTPLAKLLPASEPKTTKLAVQQGMPHPFPFIRAVSVDAICIDHAKQIFMVRYTFEQKGAPDMDHCMRHLKAPVVTYSVCCS